MTDEQLDKRVDELLEAREVDAMVGAEGDMDYRHPHVTKIFAGSETHRVTCACGYVSIGFVSRRSAMIGAGLHRLARDIKL